MTTGSEDKQRQARRDDSSKESDATETIARDHKQASPALLPALSGEQVPHLQANTAANTWAIAHGHPWAPRTLTACERAEYRRVLEMVRTCADIRWPQAIRLRRLIHDGTYPSSLDIAVRGLLDEGAYWRCQAHEQTGSLD